MGTLDRRVETRPLPLDRVVKWLPRDDAFYLLAAVLTSASAEPLVVTREALLQVERHLRAPGRASGCGVLLGATCVCPRTRIRYLLVEGTVGAVTAITEQESPATTIARLRALVTEVQRRSKRQVVGWYRGGAAIVPHLSPRDVAVHHELFADPWRVALLRDGVGPGRSGAFVRVEPVEERAYLAPFHELLPRKRWGDREARHTAVTWANYRSETAVMPLAEVAAEHRARDGDSMAPVVARPVDISATKAPPASEGRSSAESHTRPRPEAARRSPPLQLVMPVAPVAPVREEPSRPERGEEPPTQAPVRSAEPAIAPAPPPAPAPAPEQGSMQAPTQAPARADRPDAPTPSREAPAPPRAAPAPSEPLAFVWMPPKASESASMIRGPWRIALWAAAVAVAVAALLVLWRVFR